MNTGHDPEDDEDDDDLPLRARKNYITPQGLHALKKEYDHLFATERPRLVETVSWAAGNGDRSENGDYLYGKKRLREIDRRMRWLAERMKAAVVVDPMAHTDQERVLFGASVTYADADGSHKTVTLVGEDEIDLVHQRISWISPLARALMHATIGACVRVKTPRGERPLTVIAIDYHRPRTT